jgi:hypothetical protein
MAEPKQRSEKHEAARNSLPSELVPVFDTMVADYQYTALVCHHAPFVSYAVLAQMVRLGWRRSAKPLITGAVVRG